MFHKILMPLRKIHGFFYETKKYYNDKKEFFNQYIYPLINTMKEHPDSAFLVLTPEHNNLGDHAIALAEIELLNSIGIKHIEITGKQLANMKKFNYLKIMNGRPILINGGGNLGSIWFNVEQLIRDVIIRNPQSSIAILPNTIHYEDTPFFQKEKHKASKIYKKHKNLFMFAREEISYKNMMQLHSNVKLIPDMVLSLNRTNNFKRNGCLICLRNDCEKTLNEIDQNSIFKQVQTIFTNIKRTDTCLDHSVSIEDRAYYLDNKFNEFSSAELVITDRLHGMLFAAITNTPCIVINSLSPKLIGCYEWIKNLDYIRFVETSDAITEIYHDIRFSKSHYEDLNLNAYFKILARDLQEIFL